MYDSIETISNAKNIEDKYDNIIAELNNQIELQGKENNVLSDYVRATTADRDMYRKNTSKLLESKQKLEKDIKSMQEAFKKKMFEMDRDIKQKTDEAAEAFEKTINLEKEKKNLVAEREKMKERIKKLKTRKGKHDMTAKTCKNCGKEYSEKENFNWSCRMHLGEWSGEIWWCCGKDNKDQPGCKYSKHESKEDEELLDGEE